MARTLTNARTDRLLARTALARVAIRPQDSTIDHTNGDIGPMLRIGAEHEQRLQCSTDGQLHFFLPFFELFEAKTAG